MLLGFRFKYKILLLCLSCFTLISLSHSNPLSAVQYIRQKRAKDSGKSQKTTNKWDNVTRELINDVEILSLFPSSNTNDIKGVVLLLHGCNRDGMDWFLYPEEQIIVNHILSLSLAAIAISSPKRTGSRCWNTKLPLDVNPDLEQVSKAINQFFEIKLPIMHTRQQHQHHQEQPNDNVVEVIRKTKSYLPLYAIGASSGGYFIPMLHHKIPLDGMICQISASPLFRTMENIPPTVLIYMVHDFHANEIIVSSIIQDIKNNQQQETNLIKDFACHPKPITTEWFINIIPTLSLIDAQTIINDLLPLDEHTDFLLSNPRSFWSKIVNKEPIRSLDTITQLSIMEELNVAFAQHEITSDFVEEAMDFIAFKNFTENV